MSEIISTARSARETLARGLSTLQADSNASAGFLQAAEPIAAAMGALHRIERSGGAEIVTAAPQALDAVRQALAILQAQATNDPRVASVLEMVAGSLGMVFSLTKAAKYGPPPQAAAQPAAVQAGAYAPPPAAQPAPFAPQPAAPYAPPPQPAPYQQQQPAPFQAAPFQPQQPAPQPAPFQAAPFQPQQPAQFQAAPFPAQQPAPYAAPKPAPQPVPFAQPQPQPQPVPFAQPQPQPVPFAQPQPQAQPQPAPFAQQPVPFAQPQQPQAAPWGQQPAQQPQQKAAPMPQQPQQPQQPQPVQSLRPQTPDDVRDAKVPQVEAELGTHSVSNFYKGLSGNDVVDHGGLFISTYNIPPLGQTMKVKVSLPGGYEFEALGVVRWTREARESMAADVSPPGFGIQFTKISPEARNLVYRYVRNREPLFHDDL